jgi:hypothetical protein
MYDLHCGFVPITSLHSTVLTLYPSKDSFTEFNSYFNELIIDEIKNFFEKRKTKQNFPKFKLRFNEFRPGTLLKDQYPIPYASNGTVVAIGKRSLIGNKEFVKLADELVECLTNSLYPIFGDKFERKFSTIWSILGYFNHTEFDIDESFANTFNYFKNKYDTQPMEIEVNKLRLVKHSFKDLRDARILKTYEL